MTTRSTHGLRGPARGRGSIGFGGAEKPRRTSNALLRGEVDYTEYTVSISLRSILSARARVNASPGLVIETLPGPSTSTSTTLAVSGHALYSTGTFNFG